MNIKTRIWLANNCPMLVIRYRRWRREVGSIPVGYLFTLALQLSNLAIWVYIVYQLNQTIDILK